MSSLLAEDAGNLLELLARRASPDGVWDPALSIQLRQQPAPFGDASVFLGDRSRAPAGVASGVLAGLDAAPEVESARRRGRRISARLSDDVVTRYGAALEAGVPLGLETADLRAGRRYMVDFADPNATKALHVGHLRGIAVGHGLASALAAAGGEVETLSLVCDIGRTVCEALAGYLRLYASKTPDSVGVKPDVFVGRCYSAYVRELESPDAHESTPDAPIGRELEDRSDLADSLLQSWVRGDPDTRARWERLRSWVLSGQDRTLRRLGVRIDRPLLESEALERADWLVEEGLRRGVFSARSDGVVYETGVSEYERMPLVRADGFPTENLRLAAIWYDLQREGPGIEACLHVMGDEWVPLIACRERMLAELVECPLYAVYHKIGCAMVTFRGSKMKSSSGEAVLIDELLDRLAATEPVRRLASESVDAETAARIVALGFFLGQRVSKPIEFSWEEFVREGRNPGWRLARAWSQANASGAAGGPDPDPTDPAYRYAVLQSQSCRGRLADAVSSHDLSPLVRYLTQLATWYVEASAAPRCDRVMRTTLRAGLASLGLLSAMTRPDWHARRDSNPQPPA